MEFGSACAAMYSMLPMRCIYINIMVLAASIKCVSVSVCVCVYACVQHVM